jgi:uncharacterized protein
MHGSAQDRRFDAFRLAASRGELSGRVDPQTLPRLEEHVAEPGGHVDWTIRGCDDADGRPAITVALAGTVTLTCQHCLGTVTERVEQSTLLLLARDDADLVRLDEASDQEVVDAREPLDPATLVEDELLLTLPFAPRHAGECASPEGAANE